MTRMNPVVFRQLVLIIQKILYIIYNIPWTVEFTASKPISVVLCFYFRQLFFKACIRKQLFYFIFRKTEAVAKWFV